MQFKYEIASFSAEPDIKDTAVAILNSFRNSGNWAKRGLIVATFGLISALLASCGGGGASGGDPTAAGDLSILPNAGSYYANQAYTFNIAGGKKPYLVVSNEQTVMALNFTTNSNTFTVIPNQPGVVDVSTDPNIVPSRKVTLTVRDSTGAQTTGSYDVLQNFTTGYSLQISTIANCTTAVAGAATATSATQACAGAESLLRFIPITNGVRYANKQVRLTTQFGPFVFILDDVGNLGGTLVATADSNGVITARIKATAGAATQYAKFRLTDVATSTYSDFTFVVLNTNGVGTALSTTPSTLTLTGANSAECGTGTVNLYVFGGVPPYTASTTFPQQIQITPSSVAFSGGAFSVALIDKNFCLGPGTIIVRDSAGTNATVTVTTTAGTTAPILPLSVAPSILCVPDGGSGVISIFGGNTNKVINVSNSALLSVTPSTSAGDFTATLNALGAGGAGGTAVGVTISDGSLAGATISVTRKTTCP